MKRLLLGMAATAALVFAPAANGAVRATNTKVAVTPTTATVSWGASETTNLMHWLVEDQPIGGAWTKTEVGAAARSDLIQGLSPSTKYNFRVWPEVKQYASSVSATTASEQPNKEKEEQEKVERETEERIAKERKEAEEREAKEKEVHFREVNCFQNPETEGTVHIEECGYPGLNNTGPEAGVVLTKVGSFTAYQKVVLKTGEKLENKEVWGQLVVEGDNVLVKNVKIVTFGHCGSRLSECSGSEANSIIDNGNKLTLLHVTLGGEEREGKNMAQECMKSFATGLVAEYLKMQNCGGIKTDGGGTVSHSFCDLNSVLAEEHYECVSNDGLGGAGTIPPSIYKENTFFNPQKQTAAIFIQGYSSKIGEVRIENNFLAGGGRTIYGGEEDNGQTGPEVITGNRFAKATCAKPEKSVNGGNWVCGEQSPVAGTEEELWAPTPGGFYPNVGSYSVYATLGKNLTWSGNVYDKAKEPAGK